MSFLQKIFVWSLIFEPLLFFILSERGAAGVPLTASRVLQLAFLVGAAGYILMRPSVSINKSVPRSFKLAALYFLIAVGSSSVGLMMGNYDTGGFGGSHLRPLMEVFILAYYAIYFLVLPTYMLRTPEQMAYALRWTVRIFGAVVFLGLIDLVANGFGYDPIPRHLVDSRWVSVGLRFHALAGEPRDAVVYLLFGLAVLQLRSALGYARPPSWFFLLLIVGCLIMTQSFSGMVGVAIGIGLLTYYSISSPKKLATVVSVFAVAVLIGYLAIEWSSRLQDYTDAILSANQILDEEKELPWLIRVQAVDIVPAWMILNRILQFDIFPLLFGSGIGSAIFANNEFLQTNDLSNPRAQLIRLVFETGIVGLYIYLTMLVYPLRRLIKTIRGRRETALWVSGILLFGAILGHRSNLGLIFAGLLVAVMVNGLYPGARWESRANAG